MSNTREDETEAVFHFRRYLELDAVTSADDFPLSEMTPDSKIVVEKREVLRLFASAGAMTIDDLILKAGYLFAYCNEQSTQDSGWGHSSATFAAGRLVYDLLCLRVAPHLFQGPIAREGEGQQP